MSLCSHVNGFKTCSFLSITLKSFYAELQDKRDDPCDGVSEAIGLAELHLRSRQRRSRNEQTAPLPRQGYHSNETADYPLKIVSLVNVSRNF